MKAKLTSREAILKWEEYKRNLERDIDVPHEEPEVKQKRIEKLLKDPIAFFTIAFNTITCFILITRHFL